MTSLGRRFGCCVVLAAIIVTLSVTGWAKPVGSDLAFSVAKAWLAGNRQRLSMAAGGKQLLAKGIRPFRNAQGELLAYIVDLQPKGFIVVPADDLVEPILTYGTDGNFAGTLGPNDILSDMLVQDIPWRIKQASAYAVAGLAKDPYLNKVAERWARFSAAAGNRSLLGITGEQAVTPVVNPLISDLWDQGDPSGPYTYNYYTPNHYVTGCVATAMGMIMHYYKYPDSASGSNTIYVDGKPQQASFSSTYNFLIMPTTLTANSPQNQIEEVAKLLYNCGISVGMQYAADGSGAVTMYVANALKSVFHYTSADWKDGDSSDWASILKNELNAGYPAELAIRDSRLTMGHAIVCDGWGTEDNQDRFHLNMGWSGYENNWYQVPGFTTMQYQWDILSGYVYNIRSPNFGKVICSVAGPASPTRQSPITFNIRFSEDVTGLTAESINVTGGTKGQLGGSGAAYTLPVTPSADGNVTCSVPAGAAQGVTGKGNEASNTATVRFDSTSPTCEVSGPTKYTGQASVDLAIRFSEDVTGLTSAGISVTGGTAGTLSGSGSTYTLSVTPTVGQNITCQVPAGAAQDAAGNACVASNPWSITYDAGDPAVEIVQPTRNAAYATDQPTISIAGTAVDATGIASVRWVNSRGGDGNCAGTTSWTANDIALQVGLNTITVTATNPGARTGSDSIYVTYTPSNLVQISICPGNIGLAAGAQQQFRVFTVDPSGVETPTAEQVTWGGDANAGTVNSSGLFTAGVLVNTYSEGVTASVADATQRAVPVEVFLAGNHGGAVPERWWGRAPADRIDYARDVAVDAEGCIYVVDKINHRVQEFDVSGKYVDHWGSEGSGNGQFESPSGIAIDSTGNMYVVDTGNNRVQKLNAFGDYVLSWGSAGSGDGQFQSPEAIAVDSSDNVYVVDTGNCRVQKFDSNGGFLSKFGSSGTGNGQFTTPSGIAVDSAGNIYVSDRSTSSVRIQKFNSAGVYVTKWGSYGTGDGQFTSIRDVAVDSAGNVYALDSARRVQKFTNTGTFVSKWGSYGTGDGQFDDVWALATDSWNAVYVADAANCRVQKFDSLGNYAGKWGSVSGLGQFRKPGSVAVDASGDVYVVDTRNNRIQKFDAYGEFIAAWGSMGTGDGQFQNPSFVAVDSTGSIYVTDTDNHRVQKFSPAGTYVKQWGSYGKINGQFNYPVGIAVGAGDYVYVSDRWGRVQKFSSDGGYVLTMYYNGLSAGGNEDLAGVAIDRNGNLYVADETGDCIQKFDTAGTYKGKWGVLGSGNGQFMQPHGVSADSAGYVYVADTKNNRIQKFDSLGRYVSQWGSLGSAVNQFSSPGGVAVDAAGDVFVADTENNRVQKFRPYASALAPSITVPTSAPTYFTSNGTLDIGGTAVQDVVSLTWANDRGGSGDCVGTTSWSAAGIQLYAGVNRITVTAKDALNNEGADELVVTYDSVAPTVTITDPTGDPTWAVDTGPLSIAGTASDDQGVIAVAWANNRGGSGTCTGTTAWSAAGIVLYPGDNIITVTARDAVGNTSTDAITVTFTDEAAPVLAITTPTDQPIWATTSTTLNIGGTAADNGRVAAVTWSSSRGPSGVCTGTTAWTATVPLSVGTNVLTVTAADDAGNESSAVLAVTQLDAVAPTVTIQQPTANSTYTTQAATVTLQGTASDNVAVTAVTWGNSLGDEGTCTGTNNWTTAAIPLEIGDNTITITASDAAGNIASDTLTVTRQGNRSPVVTITPPVAGPPYVVHSSTITLHGTASDQDGGVVSLEWITDKGHSGNCTGTSTWSAANIPLSLGDNIITVTATDNGEATGSAQIAVKFVDNTLPVVAFTDPTDEPTWTTMDDKLDIAGTASDDVAVAKVEWSNDRGGSGACAGTTVWSVTGINLLLGQNMITVTATDSSGCKKTAQLAAIKVDGTNPIVTINSPTGSDTYTTGTPKVTLVGTAGDDVGVVSVVWSNDRGGSGVCTGTNSWQVVDVPLKTGDNVITVTGMDAAGNTGSDTVTVTLRDGTPPVVTITGPTPNATYTTGSSTIDISGTASDNFEVAQVTWCNDRTTCSVCTGTTNWSAEGIELVVGENKITVTATDAAGNTSTDTLTILATDGAAPIVTITSPTTGSTYTTTNPTVSLAGTAKDNVAVTSVEWSNDRGGSGNCGIGLSDAPTVVRWDPTILGHGPNVLEYQILRDGFGTGARPVMVVRDPSLMDYGMADVLGLYGPGPGTAVPYYQLDANPSTNAPVESTWSVPREPYGVTHTYQVRVLYKVDGAGGTKYHYTRVSNSVTATAIDPIRYSDIIEPAYDGSQNAPGVLVADLLQGNTNFSWNRKDGADLYYIAVGPVEPGTGPVWGDESKKFYENGPIVSLPDGLRRQLAGVLANPRYAGATMGWRVCCRHSADTSPAWWSSPEARFVIGATPPAFGRSSAQMLELVPQTMIAWTASSVPLFAGQNVITVTARDAAGNSSTATLTVTCTDATPPTVAITSPTTAATWNSSSASIDIAGTASDNVALASVAWSDGRGGGGACTGTTNWSASGIALVLGENTITVTATDTAGQTATDSLVVTVTDSVPPSISITEPTSDSTCSRSCGTLSIGGTATDNLGLKAITWSNSKGGSGTCTGTGAWTAVVALAPGVNVITVTAEDNAGNANTDVLAVSYEDYTTDVAAAWQGLAMVSVPLVPDVTDPRQAVGFYSDRWMMFDTASSTYIGYANDTAHKTWFEPADQTPGRGFWAYFSPQGTLPCGNVPAQDKAVSISLKAGWNLVGQPFVAAVKWDMTAIKVKAGSVEKTLDQAVTAGWIKDYAWGWTPNPTTANPYNGAYYLVADPTVATGAVDSLEPWQAYWVRAYRDCELILPPPAAGID